MKRTTEERASDLSRMLNTLQRARGDLLLAEGSVWRFDSEAMPVAELAAWIRSDRLAVPTGAASVTEADLIRIRDAVRAAASSRNLGTLIDSGVRPLKKWQGTDLSALIDEARRFESRLGAALHAGAVASQHSIDSVLSDQDRYHATSELLQLLDRHGIRPRWSDLECALPAVQPHLRLAVRIAQIGRLQSAADWLAAITNRWFPPADVRTELRRFYDALLTDPAVDLQRFIELVQVWTRDAAGLSWTYGAPADQGQARAVLIDLLSRSSRFDSENEDVALRFVLAGHGLEAAVIDPSCRETDLRRVRSFAELPPRWLRRVGPSFADAARSGWLAPPWVTDLPPNLAADVITQRIDSSPVNGWSANGLRRLVRVLRSAKQLDVGDHQWLRQNWVAEVVDSPLGDLALAVALAPGQVTAGAEDALAALALGISQGDTPLARRVREWAAADRKADAAAFPDADRLLGLTAQELSTYLNYRRMSGDEAVLPALAIEVLQGEHSNSQATRLEELLADVTLPPERRRVLENELQRLRDPQVVSARLDARRKRARNQILRATKQYRVEALQAIIKQTVAELAGPVPDDVPLELLVGVIALCGDEKANQELVRRFVDTALQGQTTVGWPENVSWLEQAGQHMQIDRWLEGISETAEIGGEPIQYVTEKNLVRAAHMGTWFDTCLALNNRGFNKASALTNAVEANRMVLYGIDGRGNVVARKLILINSQWELVGYRTYAHSDQEAHQSSLDEICARFAEECGLIRVNAGRPDSLTGAFWYNDGTEEWASSPESSPPGLLDLAENEGSEESEESETRALSARRHLMTESEVADLLDRTWNNELMVGLWLDRRIADPVALVRRLGDDYYSVLEQVASLDPDGWTDVLEQLQEPDDPGWPRGSPGLLPAPDKRSAIAAARFNTWLEPWMVYMLGPQLAVRHLAQRADTVPPGFMLTLLESQGVPARRLLAGIQGSLSRWQNYLHEEPEWIPGEWVAAWSHKMLMSALGEQASAEPAAEELALRSAFVKRHAVVKAFERWPDSARLAAAACALGYPDPPVDLLRSRSADLSVDLRRLVAYTQPNLAVVSEWEDCLDICDAVEAGIDVERAVRSARKRDWGALVEIAPYRPKLFDHPSVRGLTLEVLSGQDVQQRRSLAATYASIDWRLLKSSSAIQRPSKWARQMDRLAGVVFVAYLTDGLEDPVVDRIVIEACAAIRHGTGPIELGPIAGGIGRRLSMDVLPDAVRAARRYEYQGDVNVSDHLEWVLASRLKDDTPSLELPADALAIVLDVAFLHLNGADSDRLATALLERLDDQRLDQLVAAVLDPATLTNLYSLTQQTALTVAAQRIPNALQVRLDAVHESLGNAQPTGRDDVKALEKQQDRLRWLSERCHPK